MIERYILEAAGITLSSEQAGKLNEYCSLLQEWNLKFNLTAITNKEDIFIKHFADSILGAFALEHGAEVCDIGSGGGFPAMPLKIARPDIKITMLDSVAKKTEFLLFVSERLNLGAEIFCVRAEEFGRKEAFDAVTARAVAAMPTLLEYAAPLLRIRGKAVLYKAAGEDVSASANAQKILGMELAEARDFVLPNGDGRVIYIFEKIKATDPRFPRRGNKPRKASL